MCDVDEIKARPRPVNTGVILDTGVYGPWTRVVCTELMMQVHVTQVQLVTC